WRYETLSDVPVGFGGMEIHDRDALLRSVVTLPPLRHAGMGRAIVAALEAEAAIHHCQSMYLLPTGAAEFFSGVGYRPCARERIPATWRPRGACAAPPPGAATAMSKAL